MNIVFFGSDDFAQAHLESLIGSKHKVRACVTQPDRPKGRGMKVVISPVKECGQKHRIPVLQPASLADRSFSDALKSFQPDLFVVIAYGRLLPTEVLNIPPLGAINVHASLLPKYRGAAPINWAVINGEKETGLSIIKINDEMDAGDILGQIKINIDQEETAVTLKTKMIGKGSEFLLRTIDGLKSRVPEAQDHGRATLAPKLTKELGHIRWEKGAQEICCLVRGLLPWPSAYTFYKGKMLKILMAQAMEGGFSGDQAGTVIRTDKKGITVAAGDGSVLIKQIHLQGAKSMDAHSFVVGHAVETGLNFK